MAVVGLLACGKHFQSPVPTQVIAGNTGVAGATLSWSASGVTATTTADAQGAYQIVVPQGWTGTVIPRGVGRVFHPTYRTYTNLTADRNAEDFTPITCDIYKFERIISRLNLDHPGLEEVKALRDTPIAALEALLRYYRTRTSVHHPVDRAAKGRRVGAAATADDLAVAEDAMKHIFVGDPSYPRYFCGADINWKTCPVPDNEWMWQLNRMYFWDQMGLAYWHTADERFAAEWAFQLQDWISKSPRDDDHAYAWRSIEAAIRAYAWTGHMQYFLDSPAFTPELLALFLNSILDHADYLMTVYTKGVNWGLIEAQGLCFLGVVLPEFKDAGTWLDEGTSRLNDGMATQVNPDGHQRELSSNYHITSIRYFSASYDLLKKNGRLDAFPAGFTHTLEKMCEVPMKLGFPDGTTTQFGDSWEGAPGWTLPLLKSWADLYGRPDFLYVATQGREGTPPQATSFALAQSGFYAMRSGWDMNAICLVLKCGQDGGWHCQPDNGTFELYAGGRHLMPDSGCYVYTGDAENRDWFRQTSVHQTLTLRDQGNSAYAPSLLAWQPSETQDVLVVENASYPGFTHRRTVVFVDKHYFLIVDEALGPAAGTADLHFQLGPGSVRYDRTLGQARSDFSDGWNVLVQTLDPSTTALEEEPGKVSFVYTEKEDRPAFRYSQPMATGTPGVRFITLVVPYTGAAPILKARLRGTPTIGSRTLTFDLEIGGAPRTVSVGP